MYLRFEKKAATTTITCRTLESRLIKSTLSSEIMCYVYTYVSVCVYDRMKGQRFKLIVSLGKCANIVRTVCTAYTRKLVSIEPAIFIRYA